MPYYHATMQVQGSSRPEALKFQAAQPPAVTQGPGNHRLEHGQVDQGDACRRLW